MPILAAMLAMQAVPDAGAPTPSCRAAQLRLSIDDRAGDFNGMSHSGTQLSIRNVGSDCTLAALPKVTFRDRRGRALAAVRRAPPGMHPGPVMIPVRIGGGHRATIDLRWVSGPVYPHSRSIRAAGVGVQVGAGVLRAPLRAVLYGAGDPILFDQTLARAAEGMAAG